MKRFLTAILILAAMYGYGMGFTGYNTYKLDTPPGTGVNPPAGYIYTWETVTLGVRSTHFRDSSGTDHAFALSDYNNPANIIQTASYRFVTDTEKSTWNGKQDALSAASGSVSGYLTSSDWTTFNSKQAALGFTPIPDTRTINSKQLNANVTLTQDDIGNGSTNKVFTSTEKTKLSGIENPANIIQTASYRFVTDTEKSTWNGKQDALSAASGSVSGYLSSADWSTFNGKQAALGFIPVANSVTINGHALTGNVSVTASDVSLGNVTNESKATMFTNPVLTGKLSIAGSTTANSAEFGSFGLQSYAVNNCWLSDNYVYNTGGKYRVDGCVCRLVFIGGGFDVRTAPAGTSGSAVTETSRLLVSGNGNTSFGAGGSPAAVVHIKAGTAAAATAPVKLTAGTFNTTPEAGAVEFDGASFTFVNSDAVRRKIVATDTNTFGVATLASGTVTVSTTKVTTNSRIMLTVQSLGTVTAPKAVAITARTASTSFTITSADATDTSVVAWQIIEPL